MTKKRPEKTLAREEQKRTGCSYSEALRRVRAAEATYIEKSTTPRVVPLHILCTLPAGHVGPHLHDPAADAGGECNLPASQSVR